MATKIIRHPFVEGIQNILKELFSDEIVKKFNVELEANIYNKDVEAIWLQGKTDKYIAEVKYKENDSYVYICDIYSWATRKQTEARLLKYITDKYKTKQIGKGWDFNENSSYIILRGDYETPTDFKDA